MNENFSENLRKARLEKKLTQQRVADLLGVAKSTYCQYETFTEDEKRFFWRGIIKEIRIDSERKITVLFA